MKAPQDIPHECEKCGNPFLGGPNSHYCFTCRYIISHLRNNHLVNGEKVPVATVPAHCPCGKNHQVGIQEARNYAVVNGKIYKYCPNCEWKRSGYILEEHSVLW